MADGPSQSATILGETLHATCLALAGAGLLIRGASGSGKSSLALLLLDRAAVLGLPASLVGDDRIRLSPTGVSLVARPHPALAGRLEVRGLGLCRVTAMREAAPVRLVIDLVEAAPRLPDAADLTVDLLGISLPRLVLDRGIIGAGLAPRLVLDRLAGCPGMSAGMPAPVLVLPPDPEP